MQRPQSAPPRIGHHKDVRCFNTEGPIEPEHHYHIAPLKRLDLDYVLHLVRNRKYFVLHAPRQTGKTSALMALRDRLNADSGGRYRCVYVNVETGRAAREDLRDTMRGILARLASRALETLDDDFLARVGLDVLDRFGPSGGFAEALRRWAIDDPRPLVLLIDEIDSLPAEGLDALLHELRSCYDLRPKSFPQSVVLCGVRNVRDYPGARGGSPFNIIADSLRLGDFSAEEVAELLGQHTRETGQEFTPLARKRIWTQTLGQPWLVNALCDAVCFRSPAGRDRSRAITEGDILEAQEDLILRRVTHIEQLGERLRDGRVARVLQPMLAGEDRSLDPKDVEYARDLGLLAADSPPRIANPIYGEVVPRELALREQELLERREYRFATADGSLDMAKLLAAFRQHFCESADALADLPGYREVVPHLLLQAFLQRVANGGGRIEREYALGRGRLDLAVIWPRGEGDQRIAIECKLRRDSLERTIADGKAQLAAYMDRLGADEGHLVIFDRRKVPWSERAFRRSETIDGGSVEIWGM